MDIVWAALVGETGTPGGETAQHVSSDEAK